MKLTDRNRGWIGAVGGVVIMCVSILSSGSALQWRFTEYIQYIVLFATLLSLYWFLYARRSATWAKTLVPLILVMFITLAFYLSTTNELANLIFNTSAGGSVLIMAFRIMKNGTKNGFS